MGGYGEPPGYCRRSGMSDPTRPIWPWITAGVLLPVLYLVSFGPACWLVRHDLLRPGTAAHVYRPLILFDSLPSWASRAVCWYGGTTDDGEIFAASLANILWFENLEAAEAQ